MRLHAYGRIQAADLLPYGRWNAVSSLRSGDPQPYDFRYVNANRYESVMLNVCRGEHPVTVLYCSTLTPILKTIAAATKRAATTANDNR
jgi:hypothetical protein